MNRWWTAPLAALLLTPTPRDVPEFHVQTVSLEGRPHDLIVVPLDAGLTPDAAVVMRFGTAKTGLLSLKGAGDGTLVPVSLTLMDNYHGSLPFIAQAQLNHDSWPDVGVAGCGSFELFLGDGDLAYRPTGYLPTLGGSQHGVGFVDFDHDGDLDSVLLVNDLGEWLLDIGSNPGDGILAGVTFVYAPGTASDDGHLLLADVTGNGRFSTFVVGGSGLAMSKFPGGPPSNKLLLAGQLAEVIAVDLNGDHRNDLVVAALGADSVAVLLNDGFGEFPSVSFFATGSMPNSLVAGDLDGDGHLDLAVANRADDDVSLLLGDGTGAFTLAARIPVGDQPIRIRSSDLDLDGDLDLVIANFYGESLTILLNQLVP